MHHASGPLQVLFPLMVMPFLMCAQPVTWYLGAKTLPCHILHQVSLRQC